MTVSSCFLPGACAEANAASTCVSGIETPCSTGIPAAADASCDGVDDDCSGEADEDYVPVTSCFKPGACAAGDAASTCVTGVETACQTGTPAANDASCNDVDDDCDGQTDEDYVVATSCFKPGVCASENVASSCETGVETACKTGMPTTETCNGTDDDCDGQTDSADADIVASPTACEKQAGVCGGKKHTAEQCVSTGWQVCVASQYGEDWEASETRCDELDNDCDGETDEGCSTTTPGFVAIPAGSFWMGSPGGEACPEGYLGGGCPASGTAAPELGRNSIETLHYVTLTRPFELQATEVTQGEWQVVFPGWNPSRFSNCGDTCPVEQVSWYDTLAYANAKSLSAGLTPCYVLASIWCNDLNTNAATPADCMTSTQGGIYGATLTLNGVATPYECTGYRLPTESEWEYAYRGGGNTAFYESPGNDGTITQKYSEPLDPNLDQIAWYGGNSTATYAGGLDCSSWFSGATTCGPQPGGGKEANAWGLSDMAGNVYDWCWDGIAPYPAGTVASPAVDPSGGTSSSRVYRGGSWLNYAKFARGAYRYSISDYRGFRIGFRLARSLP